MVSVGCRNMQNFGDFSKVRPRDGYLTDNLESTRLWSQTPHRFLQLLSTPFGPANRTVGELINHHSSICCIHSKRLHRRASEAGEADTGVFAVV
jgi:hypothetical protein